MIKHKNDSDAQPEFRLHKFPAKGLIFLMPDWRFVLTELERHRETVCIRGSEYVPIKALRPASLTLTRMSHILVPPHIFTLKPEYIAADWTDACNGTFRLQFNSDYMNVSQDDMSQETGLIEDEIYYPEFQAEAPIPVKFAQYAAAFSSLKRAG